MKISVVIPVYNAERFVAAAVESALAQAETGELILVDDGSTDGSSAVCRRLAALDGRVRLLRHPDGKNHGPGASRNLGVCETRNECIAFLDADDTFLAGRFEIAVAMLEADPSLDGVYEAAQNVYEDESLRGIYARADLYGVDGRVPPDDLFEALVSGGRGCFPTHGLTFRKRLMVRAGGFDAGLGGAEDTSMWIRMAAVGRLAGGRLDRPVALRRIHGQNIVLRRAHEYDCFRSRMWEGLVAWGLAHRLERRRMLLLVDAWVEHWCSRMPIHFGWTGVSRRLHQLGFLARVGVRYPWAVRSREYRHWSFALLGGRRISAAFKRILPPSC